MNEKNAYLQGQTDFNNGLGETHNPYLLNSENYELWYEGYYYAMDGPLREQEENEEFEPWMDPAGGWHTDPDPDYDPASKYK